MPYIMFKAMDASFMSAFGSNTMITLTSTILLPFFASFISEVNSNPNERIFILSRPINRDVYLGAKFFSSLVITLCMCAISIVCIFGIYWIYGNTYITTEGMEKILFRDVAFKSVTPGFLGLNLLELTIFGTVIGQCYRYYMRDAMASIIVLLITLMYSITFSILGFTKMDIENFNNDGKELFDLQFKYLPPCLFAFGGIVLLIISFPLNRRINDGL